MTPLNISQEPQIVEIEISDLVFQETVLKRKAVLDSLVISMRTKEITASWLVEFYADNNGAYGEKITSSVVVPYMKSFTTKKDDFVDATGTSILEYETDEEGNPTQTIKQPEGTVSAFRFFNYCAANLQVNIHEMIRANGLKQNANDKF